MGFAQALSRVQCGLEAPLVQVEAHLGNGLPSFTIVGMPAPEVRESRERVRVALLSSGYEFPPGRITVNLAPVELSKQGGRFDLPIAVALLSASGQLRMRSGLTYECYGELGLAGELKPVGGLFLAAVHAQAANHAMIVPVENSEEVRLSGHTAAFSVADLRTAAARLAERAPAGALLPLRPEPALSSCSLSDVVGHWHAKRALVIAAAGGHSLLLVGPPGSGKSMLASRLPELLPPLSTSEALEVASIASMAGHRLDAQHWTRRPFRAPHHTASAHAIVGGGPLIRPGEISLAHRGVLFLDELVEFDRRVLESLREPLETGAITIARAAARLELPAQFQLIAAMNPCPCGYLGDPAHPCHCSAASLLRYRQRISGPLLDRIDIRIDVPRIPGAQFANKAPAQQAVCAYGTRGGLEDAMQQVQRAMYWRLQRSGCLSARLKAAELQRCCALPRASAQLLELNAQRLALSGRGIHRILALGRTIADLAGSETIEPPHITEAVQLRQPLGSAHCASDTL
ncbi:MAG TPA: YifB family Mg chelatase-like AAA ATPase [Steroidobacteraceae bacterium]|nr:YifB family Mg chelatase-like AAA ATPase [Steroidobacteraceae bacterium]